MRWRLTLLPALVAAAALTACHIEPPLHLAGREDVDVRFGEVILDLELVWNLDTDWHTLWWYGWDDVDRGLWGEIAYPVPSSYELRLFYLGRSTPDADYITYTSHHLTETRFRTMLDFGYHNVLAWSNVDTSDGTQVLMVNESDPNNIYATTSRTTHIMAAGPSRTVLNNPELFYSGHSEGFEITDDPADYDYYLPEEGIWVKQLHADLYPMVYIYLVQLVVYNNNGRVVGATEQCSASGLAAAVQLRSGRTSVNEVATAFELRLKRDLPARAGRHADILGGRLTTFGLCDMEGWDLSRSTRYTGSRTDLANALNVGLRFVNNTDSVYTFDVTDQMRRQAHGGVITVEIDADTLTIPTRPGASGTPAGGFDPTIAPADSIEHIFTM